MTFIKRLAAHLTLAFALTGCGHVEPKTVMDAAHDLCVTVFAGRPEIRAQAKKEGLSPIEVARAACAVNDIVRPFFAAGMSAGDEAMGKAQKLGLVK